MIVELPFSVAYVIIFVSCILGFLYGILMCLTVLRVDTTIMPEYDVVATEAGNDVENTESAGVGNNEGKDGEVKEKKREVLEEKAENKDRSFRGEVPKISKHNLDVMNETAQFIQEV